MFKMLFRDKEIEVYVLIYAMVINGIWKYCRTEVVVQW